MRSNFFLPIQIGVVTSINKSTTLCLIIWIKVLSLLQIKKNIKMSDITICTACNSENGYFDGVMNICPDCGHEWSADAAESDAVAKITKDSNGAELFDGDAVTVIKDLKVKGSSMVIKRGTKVKSIKLTDNPDEVDCRIEGSSIVLRTEFLKR